MKSSRKQPNLFFNKTANILLRIYQRVFSLDTGILGVNIKFIFHSVFGERICRFYPSCSDYSRLAISQYGLSQGIVMSLKRILRCNPWNSGGYDPIEEALNPKS